MTFNSPEFFIFLLLVLPLAAGLPLRPRVWVLTAASYLFYAASYPPYVLLLLGSTTVDYWIGKAMHVVTHPRRRRVLLITSLGVNLGLLGVFKYLGLFGDWMNAFLSFSGAGTLDVPSLLLPVGISFYTFQSLSYTLDIYRGRCQPARNFVDFAFFVSFFPQLVAGPILRATHFLPQIETHEPFRREAVVRGVELMLIGFFKKCVVADNLSPYVDLLFNGPERYGGAAVWLGAMGFATQIYCDFSGYTDIARGLGRMLGFQFPLNFRWPYFAWSPQEFWKRWHMTLSFWLRDYLYIPLGGNRAGTVRTALNLLVVWFLCGLWHGAAGHFIVWGLFQGALLVVTHFALARFREAPRRLVTRVALTAFTNAMMLVGWVLFRARTLPEAGRLIRNMFAFADPGYFQWVEVFLPWPILAMAGLWWLHLVSAMAQYDPDRRSVLLALPYWARLVVVPLAALFILVFAGQQQAFIYFQF
jgi:alginate O-acetyltransferase complex protein AlgI